MGLSQLKLNSCNSPNYTTKFTLKSQSNTKEMPCFRQGINILTLSLFVPEQH